MNDPHRYHCADYQAVEDCIEAALLARALDSGRDAVLAEFQRAERLARSSGTLRQMVRVRYLQACTDDGWFGVAAAPRNAFVHLCGEYLYRSSVWEIDYLVHLWMLARANAHRYGSHEPQAFRQAELAVTDSLNWLAGNTGGAVQAAWAQLLLACMRLTRACIARAEVRKAWAELRAVVHEAQGLPAFPLERVSQWLSRLQDVAPQELGIGEWAAQLARLRERRAELIDAANRTALRLTAAQRAAARPPAALASVRAW